MTKNFFVIFKQDHWQWDDCEPSSPDCMLLKLPVEAWSNGSNDKICCTLLENDCIGYIYLIYLSLCFIEISVTILENNLGASDPVVHVSNLDGYVYHTYTQYASANTISSIDGICFNFNDPQGHKDKDS